MPRSPGELKFGGQKGRGEMNQKDHWERVYSNNPTDQMGWYEPHLQTSLGLIRELNLAADAPMIDVGGGASTLVDDLLDAGYRSISVLDISEKALSSARARLGRRAQQITWLDGDITLAPLPRDYYELWHDRAVFHFLTEHEEQQKYRDNLLNALKPGRHLIIGVFAPEAPPKCSGLPVQRYDPEQLAQTLGEGFELKSHCKELHLTPDGTEQVYLYCSFRRVSRE